MSEPNNDTDFLDGFPTDEAGASKAGSSEGDPQAPTDAEFDKAAEETGGGDPPAEAKKEVADEKPAEPELKLTVDEPKLDGEITDDFKQPRTSADWKRFKENRNNLHKELQALKAKETEWATKATAIEQAEALQQQLQEAQTRLKEIAIVNDPTITREYDQKIKSLTENAVTGLDPKTAGLFKAAASVPNGEHRDKILEQMSEDGMSAPRLAQLAARLDRLDELSTERGLKLEEMKSNADTIFQQRDQAKQLAAQQQEAMNNQAFEAKIAEMKSRPGWKDVFANEAIASNVVASARQIFSGQGGTPDALAEMAVRASTSEMILQHAIKMEIENQGYKADIEKLRGTSPAELGGTGRTDSTPTSEDQFMDGLGAVIQENM